MKRRNFRKLGETVRRRLLAGASTTRCEGSGVVAGNRQFDVNRFRELVLYIAHQTKDDPGFGRTKLAKVLFYSDFIAYAEEGRSLTGAHYRAMRNGPFPTELAAAEKQLQRSSRARVDRWDPPIEKGEYDTNRIVPKDAPNLDLFEQWELVYVDNWIARISRATATEISDLSHDHPGWRLYERGRGIIPYETHFIGSKKPSERALERGRQLAREFKMDIGLGHGSRPVRSATEERKSRLTRPGYPRSCKPSGSN